MCYSYNVSIVSFILAMLSGLYAILNNKKTLGLLIITYGQMQLSEALIWKGIDKNCRKSNELGTLWGKYTLPSHNIAIGLGIYLESKEILPLIFGILFYLHVVYRIYDDNEPKITTNCEDNNSCQSELTGKLQWPYKHDWYTISYAISVIFLLFYIKQIKYRNYCIIFFTSTFFITHLMSKNNVLGSFWCWSAAILSPLLVYLCS